MPYVFLNTGCLILGLHKYRQTPPPLSLTLAALAALARLMDGQVWVERDFVGEKRQARSSDREQKEGMHEGREHREPNIRARTLITATD